MNLFKRIAKKIARRFRRKGVVAEQMRTPQRNFQPVTAVDLWERSFRFKETPPARAGVKRAEARLAAKLKANRTPERMKKRGIAA